MLVIGKNVTKTLLGDTEKAEMDKPLPPFWELMGLESSPPILGGVAAGRGGKW
jgi:hypothetical protein